MEQDLTFIQNQLWAVIALFIILIGSNVVCYFLRQSDKDNEPQYGDMWEKGEVDKLISKTNEHLLSHPNHAGALYFSAKAFVSKKENISEAVRRLNILKENEPTLKISVQELLDEIQQIESN